MPVKGVWIASIEDNPPYSNRGVLCPPNIPTKLKQEETTMNDHNRITNASVDWLTMTSQDDKVGFSWFDIYRHYREEYIERELHEQAFQNGFYGGVKIGHLKWGYSERLGYILIMSGQDANLLFDRIKPGPKRITRIDLCVDILLIEPQEVAQDGYDLLEKLGRKQPKYNIYKGNDGGSTLYVGSRQSQQYGRVYDKGVETGQTAASKFWRYEVEFKKPVSGQVWEHLKDLTPTERAQTIRSTVSKWFANRNITTHKEMIREGAMEIIVEKRVTTVDRKLAWLRTQVSPTVSDLVSAGLGKQVLKSLLLDKRQIDEIFKNEI